VYAVNETVRIGNTAIAVYGYVSRLEIGLDVYSVALQQNTTQA